MSTKDFAALSDAATPGNLDARGWGDGSTLWGMTNVFNDDAEALVMECIPEADAKFIVALWNAYRANQIAVIGPDAVERVARAIDLAARPNGKPRWHSTTDLATAAIAAITGRV